MCVRLGIVALFWLIGLMARTAQAHPMLDRGVTAYEEADLELALRTFDAAARNADLSVEELLQLFEMRALVHHALGDETSMRADLHRLIAVRGSYKLSRLAPPAVNTAFEEMRQAQAASGGVELRIEETSIDGMPWMVARVLRVPDDLVDHTTLQCNILSNTKTISRTSQGTSTSLRLPAPAAHDGCAATARTRQGGVLFSASIEGLRQSPQPAAAGVFKIPERKPTTDTASTKKKKKWPWIVAATAVVVAGGVTAGVVLSQRSKGNGQPAVGGVTVSW